MSRFRQVKREVRSILALENWQERLEGLEQWPAGILVPPLLSLRLDRDEAVRWHSATAFGLTAARMVEASMEKARVLMRTCMWYMNEESGNLGWGIPHFMGEAMAVSERIASEYHKILVSYIFCDEACDGNYLEHAELRRDVFWGLARLAEVRPGLVVHGERFFTAALNEDDAFSRAHAARTLGLIGADAARGALDGLCADSASVRTYLDRELVDTTVGSMAAEALESLG
ncbi:HEAT repeat domain-containing protein [Pseudodesulfovibrio sp. F-1]|uniref:HEAT repeat domain-containing protein n=1 Tax=Pseudodesulfovibrio alkaliphilus TaxID=2661613 RepID=A0A7K1KPL4_9BACT|nr:DVU0298 family protein [Pseudodesulfovibrio alkaliphilus]MUM78017.1 HEAT repeat domain-containing protein [Pseudodesulfovibrio alkaliphilus]